MTNSAPKPPTAAGVVTPQAEDESWVRARRRTDPNFSLGQRMGAKLAAATELLAKLEPQDARARLLHIAVLRQDESLLDGVLAELSLQTRR